MGSNRKGRDIDTALCKKGFRRISGGKHVRYVLTGRAGIRTMISHGMLGSSLDAKLIGDMARQLRISKEQFLALIDCSMNSDEYRSIIEEQG
jgi:hypothetical protein